MRLLLVITMCDTIDIKVIYDKEEKRLNIPVLEVFRVKSDERHAMVLAKVECKSVRWDRLEGAHNPSNKKSVEAMSRWVLRV